MYRKDLIDLLLDNPMSIRMMRSHVHAGAKELEGDLQHLFKSLKHTEFKPVVHPARCRKCDFEFGPDKLLKPSKCPKCHGTWLTEPEIGVTSGGERGNED